MNAEILIVSYAKDYDFLSYTLRAIAKFGSGFAGVTLVVPTSDEARFRPLAKKHDVNLRLFYEAAGKGFLHHQVCKCEADLWCPKGTDVVVHFDSDCITKEPFTPDTFMRGGKPVLVREHFDDFKHYAARYSWRKCVEHALGVDMEWETMVRHPGVFRVGTYGAMRRRIEQFHGYPFTQYVLLQRNEFPQTFAEFPTIGGYALAFERDDYVVVTRVVTPSERWRDFGVTPMPRDAKGVPVGTEEDLNLWGETRSTHGALVSPVKYFWSRGGVTPKMRGEIENLLA